MEIILLERIGKLGAMGDVVSVKDGYARNYLLPQNKAVIATPQNRKMLEQESAKFELQIAKERKLAEEMAQRLEGVVCKIAAKVSEEDRLYGSVSARDIVDALARVMRQDAFNHRDLQAVDGMMANGMSVMAMGAHTGCNTVYGSTPPNNPHPYPCMNSLFQDGYATGRLSGLDIDQSGVVLARFSNGQSTALGKIALANFANPQGLTPLGDSVWGDSYSAGDRRLGEPGAGNFGLLQSGALEASNVEITEELVSLINAQRSFQANAQVISTADSVTQTIMNIRR